VTGHLTGRWIVTQCSASDAVACDPPPTHVNAVWESRTPDAHVTEAQDRNGMRLVRRALLAKALARRRSDAKHL
jgi:hypothetical protein